ncbi:hypothetical protein [Streptomyces sp. UNOB3_S3]|uniref:hypothetical protein n=1 Tax=Streptomyces sp. UNOB3_S3 TaxID=2871682 RepID=UPI001E6522E9|nr:hypothetical protein [Streptomyces sp. UNOB3_S3]MCC3775870.1 hypothetical protein [Streptomyces sp. UNOB3_S3]
MSLHADQFFTEHLALPFNDSIVVGNTYYATPTPGSALRLRIDFTPTIRHGEYDGLRLQVIHPEQGMVDNAVLAFADHDTFTRRDAVRKIHPGYDGYARIRDWHRAGELPWKGADVRGLRRAIEQYAQVWFPGAVTASAPPRTPPAPTTGRPPAAPAGRPSRAR